MIITVETYSDFTDANRIRSQHLSDDLTGGYWFKIL